MRRVGQVLSPTSISAASCGTSASGGVLCRPTSATPPARWSIAVPWRERPPFGTAWRAKPAASEVVAHATLSLPQPERFVVGRMRLEASKRADPRREQRPSRRDYAARNSRAQGAPRFLGSAPPALRAADGLDRASRDPSLGNYRRPIHKCLTTCTSGATFESSSLAAPQPPPHRPMWSTFESAVSGHNSFHTSQTTSWSSLRATARPRNR